MNKLEQEFSREKEIKNDERLSEFGRKEALKDLTAKCETLQAGVGGRR